mmetsp:Transcript_16097/g.34993  ORF Transcript_16097/g.34993 Transcript_16097/m.34993 type:complete len:422 (+) Transcript_16097:281-1546(+)
MGKKSKRLRDGKKSKLHVPVGGMGSLPRAGSVSLAPSTTNEPLLVLVAGAPVPSMSSIRRTASFLTSVLYEIPGAAPAAAVIEKIVLLGDLEGIMAGLCTMFGTMIIETLDPHSNQQMLQSASFVGGYAAAFDDFCFQIGQGADSAAVLSSLTEPVVLPLLTCWASKQMRLTHSMVGAVEKRIVAAANAVAGIEEMPAYLRSMALIIRADMSFGSPESNASRHRMDEVIIRRRIRALTHSGGTGSLDSSCPLVAFALQRIAASNRRLAMLEGPSRNVLLGSPSNATSSDVFFSYTTSVGGGYCDCCGKSPSKVGMANLLKCGTCRLAHYCSGSCAKSAWAAGHKNVCKPYGCFKVGDRVIAQDVVADTRYYVLHHRQLRARMGEHVGVVKGRAQDGGWQVAYGPAVVSVRSKDLRHPRPLA